MPSDKRLRFGDVLVNSTGVGTLVAWPLLCRAHLLADENRELAATRDLLLPRLVTGRLDISNIDLGDLLSAVAA